MPSDSRATTLYPVGPRTRTMMQSWASAAKLRGGGPILHFGIEAKETRRDPATSNRHRRPVTSGEPRPEMFDAFGAFRSCYRVPTDAVPVRARVRRERKGLIGWGRTLVACSRR